LNLETSIQMALESLKELKTTALRGNIHAGGRADFLTKNMFSE